MNKKVQIMQNESETEFHRVYKVSPTQQLTKLTHLLRESGAVVFLVRWLDQLNRRCVHIQLTCDQITGWMLI